MLTRGGRLPGDLCPLARLHRDLQVGGRVRRRGDAGRPGQPVRQGGVGVVQPELVPRPRQSAPELDSVADLCRPEGGVGRGGADSRPEGQDSGLTLCYVKLSVMCSGSVGNGGILVAGGGSTCHCCVSCRPAAALVWSAPRCPALLLSRQPCAGHYCLPSLLVSLYTSFNILLTPAQP